VRLHQRAIRFGPALVVLGICTTVFSAMMHSVDETCAGSRKAHRGFSVAVQSLKTRAAEIADFG
jgi:hypothetical protein